MPEAHSLNLIFNNEMNIIGYFYHYNLDDDRTSFRKTTSTHFSSETEIHLLAMVLFLLPFHVYNIFSRAFLASNFLKTHLSDQQEEKENIEWTDARERWRRFRVPPCVFFFSAEQSLPRRRPSITRKTRLVHPGRGPRGFGFAIDGRRQPFRICTGLISLFVTVRVAVWTFQTSGQESLIGLFFAIDLGACSIALRALFRPGFVSTGYVLRGERIQSSLF